MEERRKNLVTIRMDDHDRETLEYLSDRMNRTKTETIMRACKFFSGVEIDKFGGDDIREKGRKSHYIHMRVTDSDKIFLDERCREGNESVSKFVRKSIKAYYRSISRV